jgi:IS5 family transposase
MLKNLSNDQPERLPKATLLIALYSVRSDRLFCETLDYNILFRWFLDMGLEEASFDHATFSRNRQRLIEHEIAKGFFAGMLDRATAGQLLSDEHFTVDGTFIESWASFRLTDSTLFEPRAAAPMLDRRRRARARMRHPVSTPGRLEQQLSALGADKGYFNKGFVALLTKRKVAPHIARIESRSASGLDRRTTRHKGYAIGQRKRKRIEEIFGWMKTVGGFRKTRFVGIPKMQLAAYMVGAAYNLLRMARLQPNRG